MVNTTTIAWAIPVKVDQLGARIEAYVASKATISTFRVCVKYGNVPGAFVGRLPVEVVDIIAMLLREPFFDETLQKWEKDIRCCEYRCKPEEHFTQHELIKMIDCSCYPSDDEAEMDIGPAKEEGLELKCQRMRGDLQDSCEHLREWFWEDGEHNSRHRDIVDTLMMEIGEDPVHSATGRFVTCREVCRDPF